MTELTIGYSPCPNDTFIFFALTHGLLHTETLAFRERLEDVETLNRLAMNGELDITKISYHAFGHLRDRYVLLRSGGALGRGCGPLLTARDPVSPESLRGKRIAVPGRLTTASLLLQLLDRELAGDMVEMPFYDIPGAVSGGRVDAGLIIHESRFTYGESGLVALLDLGQWWEGETGLPIPLGGILAHRRLGSERVRLVERLVRASLEHGFSHPESSMDHIRRHARELDDHVIRQHIDLYVNDFSLDLGREGEQAVRELLGRAEGAGIIPPGKGSIFAD
jgi:1,4-dihydroxy-6-naphthoate synthase